MFDRLISLIGNENFKKINNKNVLIIGIGGVGGYALEGIVRSGFTNITIIDYDNIDVSNLNRQIVTTSNNIGTLKVKETEKRMKYINPNINLISINQRLNQENLKDILKKNYDYIIDACDTLEVKFELMKLKKDFGYKLISSMGTAKKLNPEKLQITTLDKTSYDPIARRLRYMLRKEHIKGKFYVVSSTEEVHIDGNILGSVITVPAVAGLYLASFVINDIINN